MIWIMLNKSNQAMSAQQASFLPDEDLNHGTKALACLVMPWARTLQTVVANSYFASVHRARFMSKIGL